ncbi:hypothetical protein CLIB1444_02S02542 [[Candida] jaroonii]|uniref:Uncharacterized protein n=1 Tax=[Candida] jaroonii TaxID=467808 RepID=A0ACA9Y2N5_9ASCO|nr:hypothetical protein CLIB1444_02S02542 [[Candida] jaroonii]
MDTDIMNTPIKRISKLSIKSPNLKQIMVDKGYSNTISDVVLNEMNKYIDIDDYESPDDSPKQHNKFDSIHKSSFSKMESISDHYTVYQKKKRRTLTGIEESPVFEGNSELTRKPLSPIKSLSPTKHLTPNISPDTHKELPSPNRSQSPNKSPNKISPSKKSYNLNDILTRKISYPKSRTPSPLKDKSNLQSKPLPKVPSMVTEKPRIPSLQHQSSIPKLQAKTSVPSFRQSNIKSSIPTVKNSITSQNTSIPTLNHKSSIPTLNHKSSIPTLNHKSSTPTLNHKSSIPTLNHKSSIPTLNHKSSIPTLNHKSSNTSINTSKIPTLQKKPSSINQPKLFTDFVKPKANVVKPITTFNQTTNVNHFGFNPNNAQFNAEFERNLKRKSSNQSLRSVTFNYERPTFSSSKKCK